MSGKIIEFELAGDVQEFVKQNFDVDYKDPSIKETIKNAKDLDILKVVKTIDSPTTFISVDLVDEEFIEKKF
ncbi:TPA: hypothetical protein DEQ89_01950 [Candidatus Daviesbacteria bacterium]|nr:hypothetical protein [Candidatus Daviesbacteria bacterium]HLC62655.1 hypothetical protein [Candidatus Nanoarchaeia archaeon]